MDIERLRHVVTMFSAEFPLRARNGAHVTVGGEVKNVVFIDPSLPVTMVLDDGLGELVLTVPGPIYEVDSINMSIGDIIVASGRVLVSKTCDSEGNEYQVVVRKMVSIDEWELQV